MWVIFIFSDFETGRQSLREKVLELGREKRNMKEKGEGTQRGVQRGGKEMKEGQEPGCLHICFDRKGFLSLMVDSLCWTGWPRSLHVMTMAYHSHMDLLGHMWPNTARFAKDNSVKH